MIFLKIRHLNSSSFEWLKIKFFKPLLKPNFKCVRNYPTFLLRRVNSNLEIRTTKKAISKCSSYTGQKTRERSQETGKQAGDRRKTGGRQDMGDRQETETGKRRTGEGRQVGD